MSQHYTCHPFLTAAINNSNSVIFYGHCTVDLVNFIVIGIFINKNTYIIPTNAYVTYRSVKDTDNVSRHVFSTESTHVNPRGHLLEVISPL